MKRPVVFFCALFLASCASANTSATLPAAGANSRNVAAKPYAAKFTPIFSFDGKDGKEPAASLIVVNGTLYGTTYAGGANDEGTVFKITTSGSQSVLHSFKGGLDGALPLASLTSAGGALYGTTVNGGKTYGGQGVAFAISSSGKESVLHRFGTPLDGANPYAALTSAGGTLYGTTAGGGKYSDGTVFTIVASGKERVLHSFNPGKRDGTTPLASLLAVKGTLYGTAAYGGDYCGTSGCGTVFTITTSGSEKTLHSFKGKDGSTPSAPLIDLGGTLYGTTAYGGSANDGTVFKITPSGALKVLYNFQGGSDGAVPQSLVAVNGRLYGTTSAGGSANLGTIFAVTPSGSESVIYTFTGGTDGATPRAGLVDAGGTLYGTTAAGGSGKVGTVFSVTP